MFFVHVPVLILERGCLGETCLIFLSGVSCAFIYAGRFASLLVGVERNVNFV